MVNRALSLPQLNSSSGGGSVNRRSHVTYPRGQYSSDKVRNQRETNNSRTVLPRSRSVNNNVGRFGQPIQHKQSTTPTSGSRNTPIYLRSQDNEIGSADTLEIVASKSTGSDPSTPEDNVHVVVRVRPLNDKEKRNRDGSALQFPGNGQIIIEGSSNSQRWTNNSGDKSRVFTYNVVFEPGATQEDVLEYSGIKRMIEMAIEGFSCTAFCYGQTGSGKTHTLTGPPDLFKDKPNLTDSRHGLVFRSFVHLFQMIKKRTGINFVLKASFMEIYNERVIDLLNPGSLRKALMVRWSKKSGSFFVENLFMVECEELDDLLAVLEEGMRNRAVGVHAMNDNSSRSHTILTVHITSEQQAEGGVFLSKHGKFNFVDLAGSELTKKTLSEGKTLGEANNINKSLMVLGYCIASLSDSKKRFGHIPYRNSQLTKLLADSLAGNGVTLMIACVSPSRYNYAETLNTLRYASRAKRIRTKPVIIMDPREALILSLKSDVERLKLENEHLRAALNLSGINSSDGTEINSNQGNIMGDETAVPKIDLERLPELNVNELAELIKLYMQENETLRQENHHLFTVRETILRDQEIVCRENERLLKKLEDVNKVCVRSPLIPARRALSPASEGNNTTPPGMEIWTNPQDMQDTNSTKSRSISRDPNFSSAETAIVQQTIDVEEKPIAPNILKVANTFRDQNPSAIDLITDQTNTKLNESPNLMTDMLT